MMRTTAYCRRRDPAPRGTFSSRNATSLKQIIEDVLDVSGIVAGRVRLNVEAVDLPGDPA